MEHLLYFPYEPNYGLIGWFVEEHYRIEYIDALVFYNKKISVTISRIFEVYLSIMWDSYIYSGSMPYGPFLRYKLRLLRTLKYISTKYLTTAPTSSCVSVYIPDYIHKFIIVYCRFGDVTNSIYFHYGYISPTSLTLSGNIGCEQKFSSYTIYEPLLFTIKRGLLGCRPLL